jgi:hypothetical protein
VCLGGRGSGTGTGTGVSVPTKPAGARDAQPELVVQQRLHRRMPERSLGLEVLSPDPDIRLQPPRLVGPPQPLQSRLLDGNRRELQ